MHSVLEGVIKKFFNYWFGSKYSSEQFSLRRNMQEIDQRLVAIRPPSFIPSAPRMIKDSANWRAKEYLSFILFYSLPLFYGIMPAEQFNNLKKLVCFLEFLLNRRIKASDLNKYQSLIESFVEELSSLYHPTIMLSGVHELLHLIEITKQFGPINLTNCFVYEELNRKLTRMINGKDLIGEEFIKIFSTLQSLGAFINNSTSKSTVMDFAKKTFIIKTSNKKFLHKNTLGFKINDSVNITSIGIYRSNIETHFDGDVHISIVSHCVTLNGVRFSSIKSSTNFGDCYFKTKKKKKFGCIEFFFVQNEELYVYAKTLLKLSNIFNISACESKIALCCISTDSYFIVKLDSIEKLFGCKMFTNDKMLFISEMKASHLFT